MALLTRLQWTLLRLGFAQTWAQALFVSVVLLAALIVMLRQDGLMPLAKASSSPIVTPFFVSTVATPWHTVYELDSLAAQAQADTVSWLRATDPRQARSLKAQNQRANQSPKGGLDNGESLFLETYRLQSEGQYTQALQLAQTMVERFPHFQLGQLAYADLMASMAAGVSELDGLMQNPEAQQRLAQLKTEAVQRTRHAGDHTLQGGYPEPLRFLSPSVQQVVVVDAKKSRLYLLTHRTEGQGHGRLQVVFDAYVSIGNKGMGKWREGDAKTPTGVYFVQKHMTDPMLPDLYGSGALTLDYPNPLDKLQHRTGSGIWLHGSPSQQYARPPTSTDGCVVLANDDMLMLVQLGVRAGTPVIIAEQINWLTAPSASSLAKSSFGADGTWPQPLHTQQKSEAWTLVSAFEWTDQQRQVAVLSHELLVPGKTPKRHHSYWVKDQERLIEVGAPLLSLAP